MAHDVFISHHTSSSLSVTQAVCNSLEGKGIRCWYAPRDTQGDYATSIYNAIQEAKVFILILNKEASYSEDVLNEINLATQRVRDGADLAILPFHISSDDINGAAKYYLARFHWIDAVKPPMQDRIKELTDRVVNLLGKRMDDKKEDKSSGRTVPEVCKVLQPEKPPVREKRNEGITCRWLSNLFFGGMVLLILIGIIVSGVRYFLGGKSTVAEDEQITDSQDIGVVNVKITSTGNTKNDEVGKNEYGETVWWTLYIEIDDTVDNINQVTCSWDDNITYEWSSEECWDSARKGQTHWDKATATTYDERELNLIEISLPDDPAIAGEQHIMINGEKIEFELVYEGDYSSGTGWSIKNIKY